MAKLMSTIIDGFISSKKFVSGLWGEGWRIGKRNNRYTLEVDDIVVRNTMTVFELLISKIRAVKGALGITQASGKVKAVTSDEYHFFIEVEGANAFRVDDIIRCMEVGDTKREYWVVVSGVEGNILTIARSEFGAEVPQAGDEIVQFGNISDKRRQSAIYLHANENGEPAIDVLFNIREKSFEGCTKIHLGGEMPGYPEVKGFYCENGMIRSENEAGEAIYCLYPDGSGFVAKGNISWDAGGNGSIFNRSVYWDRDGFHFSPEVKLTWGNLPEGTQWVEEWTGASTRIGNDYVISPRIFSGIKSEDGSLTGVALGRGIMTIDENGKPKEKTGIFGLKAGKPTFEIDAETGETMYRGQLNVNDKFKVDKQGRMTAIDGIFDGKVTAKEGNIGGFEIGPSRIGKSVSSMESSTLGMSLYGNFIRFKASDRLAAIGASTFASSTAVRATARFEISDKDSETSGIHNIALYLNATGCPETYTDVGQNYALYIENGGIFMNKPSHVDLKVKKGRFFVKGIEALTGDRKWSNCLYDPETGKFAYKY